MSKTSHCRICLEPLALGEEQYHPSCCKALFGETHPPALPYSHDDLNKLAERLVLSHVAVPGVQPKLSLHLERDGGTRTGRFTLVGLEGGFILKPPVEQYPQMPELEHLTMRMAESFGIETASCGLIELKDHGLALIVKRMDRDGESKLAMEDMCQLTDRLTEEKYRGSLESVGKVILSHCSNPGLDALRFLEVNLFCFLTGNADMHLKNFSLLRTAEGEIRLAPAYDLLPTVLLLPEDKEECALTLNGKKSRIGRRDFVALGLALGLTERQISNVFQRFEKFRSKSLLQLERCHCIGESAENFRQLIKARWDRLID